MATIFRKKENRIFLDKLNTFALIQTLILLIIFTACGNEDVVREYVESEEVLVTENLEKITQPDLGLKYVTELDRWIDGVPLMWHVTSPSGQTMYMLGTIHAGTPNTHPLPDFIMNAFHRSGYLALEINPLNTDFEAAIELFTYADDRTIVDDLGDNLYEVVAIFLMQRGISQEIVINNNNLKPLAWVSIVQNLITSEAGLSHAFGLENVLFAEALERNMNILEANPHMEQQIAAAGMSIELQVAWLETLVNHWDISAHRTRNLYNAWKRGDAEWILNNPSFLDNELLDEFNNIALTQRSVLMANRARQWMADGKNVFFAVGLMHFLHDEGIINLLIQEGYEVVRIAN